MHVERGDQVSAGQTLATLDTELLEREHDQLEAQYRQTEARLQLTQQNLARINALRTKKFASAQARDQPQSQREIDKATLDYL